MFKDLRPAWAEINLDNLENNIKEIRRVAESRDVIAVIKADGYGHGALDIAPTLLKNGANRLAVAAITEAVELRKGGIECPIMILGFTPPTFAEVVVDFDIEQTVYTYELAKALSDAAVNKNKLAKIQISLDTGMGRIGYIPNETSVEEVYKISKLPNIIIEGLFSHFATADEKDKEYTMSQVERYNWFYNKLTEKGIHINTRHVANSATIIDLPEIHFDAVRPGIILYGYYPSDEVNKKKISLKPVMTLKANVVNVKTIEPGQYVSYGRKFKAERKTVIATLPIGYADGYTRLLFNKAKVIINGKFAPVVGRICMDQCMIDVTDVGEVNIGDEVILLGESNGLKFNADDIAKVLGTISYEVTCAVGKRVPRVYIKDNKVIKVRNYV